MAKEDKNGEKRIVLNNRKARHEYFIEDTVKAGLVLVGTEVKSLRAGRASLSESYARLDKNGEAWLHNMHISPHEEGGRYNVDPIRARKLLLTRKELNKLAAVTEQKGLTLVRYPCSSSTGSLSSNWESDAARNFTTNVRRSQIGIGNGKPAAKFSGAINGRWGGILPHFFLWNRKENVFRRTNTVPKYSTDREHDKDDKNFAFFRKRFPSRRGYGRDSGPAHRMRPRFSSSRG
jgi:SsrA-binding protein